MQIIFTDNNEIKLETNNNKIYRKNKAQIFGN